MFRLPICGTSALRRLLVFIAMVLIGCDDADPASRAVPRTLGGPTAQLHRNSQPPASTAKEVPNTKLAVEFTRLRAATNGREVEFELVGNAPVSGGIVRVRRLDESSEVVTRFAGMAAGERRIVRVPVAQSEDGNYSIGIGAVADSSTVAVHGGLFVERAAHATAWLIYRGGRLAEVLRQLPWTKRDGTPDPEWSPGPRRKQVSTQICDPDDPTCTPPPGGSVVRGSLIFLDARTLTPRQLYKASVRLMGSDMIQRGPTALSDAYGQFVINRCPSASEQYTLWVETTNPTDVQLRGVKQGVSSTQVGFAAITPGQCDSNLIVNVLESDQATVFAALVSVVERSRSVWGTSLYRGQIRAGWANGTGVSAYLPASDSVHVVPGGLWGAARLHGLVGHEYAHSLHHVVGGGVPPQTQTCTFHAVAQPTDLACALAEGLADALAMYTDNSVTLSGYSLANFESNSFVNSVSSPASEGYRTEGAVAAFLLDLIDGTGADAVATPPPGHPASFTDNVQYPLQKFADTLRTCEVNFSDVLSPGGRWRRYDGIDALIYCFERLQKATPQLLADGQGHLLLLHRVRTRHHAYVSGHVLHRATHDCADAALVGHAELSVQWAQLPITHVDASDATDVADESLRENG